MKLPSGEGHAPTKLIKDRDLAHDLGVKLSLCMCSHIVAALTDSR